MSSENNAPPTITPRLTVPRPDTDASSRTGAPAPARHGEADGSSSNGTSGGSSNGASKASSNGAAAGAVPPPPPPPPATTRDVPAPAVDDDGMERASGESRVAVARAGAVKAAAAAIAAAKSAAKKVSAAVPAAPAETEPAPGHDEIDDETVRRVPTTTSAAPAGSAAPAATARAAAGSSMHYSAAGVTGTATPVTGATPAVGTATGATPAVRHDGGPRRVRLAVSRIDPWSAMKLGFLLAVAIGIMTVVATAVVWYVLDGMQVFFKIEELFTQIVGTETDVDIQQYVAFGRVISIATLLGVVNVVIITALSTIMAFLYNIVAALVGGVHLTLTDD